MHAHNTRGTVGSIAGKCPPLLPAVFRRAGGAVQNHLSVGAVQTGQPLAADSAYLTVTANVAIDSPRLLLNSSKVSPSCTTTGVPVSTVPFSMNLFENSSGTHNVNSSPFLSTCKTVLSVPCGGGALQKYDITTAKFVEQRTCIGRIDHRLDTPAVFVEINQFMIAFYIYCYVHRLPIYNFRHLLNY